MSSFVVICRHSSSSRGGGRRPFFISPRSPNLSWPCRHGHPRLRSHVSDVVDVRNTFGQDKYPDLTTPKSPVRRSCRLRKCAKDSGHHPHIPRQERHRSGDYRISTICTTCTGITLAISGTWHCQPLARNLCVSRPTRSKLFVNQSNIVHSSKTNNV